MVDSTPWRNNPFTRSLGVDVPIVLAPMAGGPSTAELAASVSGAGVLGTLGLAYLGPDAIGEEIGRLRWLTDRPFAVNLFVVPVPPVDPDQLAAAWAALAPYRAEVGLADLAVPERFGESFEDQVEAVLRARAPI